MRDMQRSMMRGAEGIMHGETVKEGERASCHTSPSSAVCPEREAENALDGAFLPPLVSRVARPLSYPVSGSHCRRGRDKGVGAYLLGEVGCHVLLNKAERRQLVRGFSEGCS
jgi:hypothetical protein